MWHQVTLKNTSKLWPVLIIEIMDAYNQLSLPHEYIMVVLSLGGAIFFSLKQSFLVGSMYGEFVDHCTHGDACIDHFLNQVELDWTSTWLGLLGEMALAIILQDIMYALYSHFGEMDHRFYQILSDDLWCFINEENV